MEILSPSAIGEIESVPPRRFECRRSFDRKSCPFHGRKRDGVALISRSCREHSLFHLPNNQSNEISSRLISWSGGHFHYRIRRETHSYTASSSERGEVKKPVLLAPNERRPPICSNISELTSAPPS